MSKTLLVKCSAKLYNHLKKKLQYMSKQIFIIDISGEIYNETPRKLITIFIMKLRAATNVIPKSLRCTSQEILTMKPCFPFTTI